MLVNPAYFIYFGKKKFITWYFCQKHQVNNTALFYYFGKKKIMTSRAYSIWTDCTLS
jgi:hypothetical protein